MSAIQLMKKITTAKVSNDKINSKEIFYSPQSHIKGGKYNGGA